MNLVSKQQCRTKPFKHPAGSVDHLKYENVLNQQVSVFYAFQCPETPCIC